MSKTYILEPAAEAIVARQLAAGHYKKPEDVVRAGLELLERQGSDVTGLRRLVDEGDADIAAGRLHCFADAEALTADITARGAVRSKRSP